MKTICSNNFIVCHLGNKHKCLGVFIFPILKQPLVLFHLVGFVLAFLFKNQQKQTAEETLQEDIKSLTYSQTQKCASSHLSDIHCSIIIFTPL